jgi:hypothetical protein
MQPPLQPPAQQPPRRRNRLWLILAIGGGILVLACVVCSVSTALSNKSPQAANSTPSPTTVAQAATTTPTKAPTPSPTPTPAAQYPPKTEADLHALAAQGDASAINGFHSESVGLTGICPQPKVEATVSPKITGKQLAEDMLAYFYGQGMENPCGSVLFVYHNQSEANGDTGYTAGRVLLDVTDSSGQPNTDPNATNLKYTLTLDTGDVVSGQEYVVTYQK